SRDAQAAIRTAAEEGLSARNADADRRVVTLVEAATGISVGVATLTQLQTLERVIQGDILPGAVLRISPALLAYLKQPGSVRDLRELLKHILGKAEEITLRVEA
ncbi:MAG TPA: hypothetical protein VMT24_13260, partial [Aggregatilineaceae bacterium]|nr:hypothetical protein [Aggregatilineaceae bacterium]